MAGKQEYPPILPAGLHKMSAQDLGQLVVSNFPLSTRREGLWKNLLFVYQALLDLKIPCDIWVDGSFLTKKIDPDDVDFMVDIPLEYSENGTGEQMQFIENLSDQLYRAHEDLHSFVVFKVPANHPLGPDMERARRRWQRDFGFALMSKEPKGIALLEVQP